MASRPYALPFAGYPALGRIRPPGARLCVFTHTPRASACECPMPDLHRRNCPESPVLTAKCPSNKHVQRNDFCLFIVGLRFPKRGDFLFHFSELEEIISGFELEHRSLKSGLSGIKETAVRATGETVNRELLSKLRQSGDIASDLMALYSDRPYMYARVMQQLGKVLGKT